MIWMRGVAVTGRGSSSILFADARAHSAALIARPRRGRRGARRSRFRAFALSHRFVRRASRRKTRLVAIKNFDNDIRENWTIQFFRRARNHFSATRDEF